MPREGYNPREVRKPLVNVIIPGHACATVSRSISLGEVPLASARTARRRPSCSVVGVITQSDLIRALHRTVRAG